MPLPSSITMGFDKAIIIGRSGGAIIGLELGNQARVNRLFNSP